MTPSRSAPTIVTTTSGPVQGRERRGVQLYAGIPYAAPPTGRRRFAPPEPPEPWTELRDATRFGTAAPQRPGEGLTNGIAIPWDEDCLTLNVMTPRADDARRPVYVWIHGGDFKNGTGGTPWYDGTSFAARGDIVAVTINYRLGAFGFVALGDGAPHSGIVGLLDQIAALEWVRDNIGAFGGDPTQVTIGGESAGAFSVSTLLAMPEAAGLCHRAIAQSGAGHMTIDPETAVCIAAAFCAAAGTDDLDELRALPPDVVLDAQQAVQNQRIDGLPRHQSPFYPAIGPGGLAARPIDAMEGGASAAVPLLTGVNDDETALFGMGATTDDRLVRIIGHYLAEPEPMIAHYRRVLPGAGSGQLAVAISTDHTFTVPAVRMAAARAVNGGDTWMYAFSWRSRSFDGALGACHALEIPFTFNTLDRAGVDLFLGPGARPDALAERMHDSWIAFIRTGDPATDATGPWPTFTPDHPAVADFGTADTLLDDPWGPRLAPWHNLR